MFPVLDTNLLCDHLLKGYKITTCTQNECPFVQTVFLSGLSWIESLKLHMFNDLFLENIQGVFVFIIPQNVDERPRSQFQGTR